MTQFSATVSLFAFILAAPALAQDAPPVGHAPTVGADPGQTASTAAGSDLEMLLTSIRSGKTNIGAIASLTSVGEVGVVRVGRLEGGDARVLETAISENKADIAALQGAIASNPAVKAKLDENSVQVPDVVAARVEADGSLTVFAR